MGFFLSKVWNKLLSRKKEVRILMVGLDAAGQTTILYQEVGSAQCRAHFFSCDCLFAYTYRFRVFSNAIIA